MTTATKKAGYTISEEEKARRKEYAQTRTKELERNLEQLANEIVTDPARLSDFVKQWTAGFYNYSIGNTLLILNQNPLASMCASYKDWISKHNRYVRKGEKGLTVLVPVMIHKKADEGEDGEEKEILTGFTCGHVFDISQTDGEEIKGLGGSRYTSGRSKISFDKIKQTFKEYQITITESGGNISGYDNGSTTKDGRIYIRKAESASMIRTLAHEIAHNVCGHMTEDGIKAYGTPEGRQRAELEAEATAYLVTCWLGIENTFSANYIGNWKGDASKLRDSGRKVLTSANKIIRRLDKANHS